ncbi:MAG TPA: ImcF-related family protein [Candidatus Acidoferrum sp.]
MQLSGQHIAGGVGLVFAAMLAWFGALWLNLQGANLWFARICIFLLLALAVLAIAWWLGNRKKDQPAEEPSADSESSPRAGATDDLLLILREAEARVASSTQLPRGTKLSSLPVIFLVGGSSSGKTCVATQSGLDPELIAGQVYQEGNIAPTRMANLWFARKAVFVEMGGKTLGDANLWSRLLHRIAPGKLRSIFSGKPAAPRAAVVCYDSAKLAKAAGPEEITAQARAIRARLEQITQTLGIRFPVYVLFTQADRLPYFDDFFRNLSDSEVTQVLGVTLPPLPATATGVYAEQETKRLTAAFESVFHSLAECRAGLLYRERTAERLPGIYEFPREMQKRIPLVTQFLVDLCRPSHLRSGAFLRGFYFTGIRQVETAAPLGGTVLASKTSLMPSQPFSANATSLMRAEDFSRTQSQGWQSATQTGLAAESGKTTQWLFLSHIFSHVILQDHTALGASGSSSKANVLKRVILATVCALAAIWFFGIMISFFGNRSLQQDVGVAANGIVPITSQPLSLASLEDLQRLEAARVQLQKLTKYHRAGAPWHLRWGLYSGDSLYEDLRALYFDRFKKLLFGDVQNQMASFLRARPPSPANVSDADYSLTYDTLKAYLMTTLKPEKTDASFLSQSLLGKWSGPADSPEQKRLALAQFTYYTEELPANNPFPTKDDPSVLQAVNQSRLYLKAFTGTSFVYRGYLDKVRQTCKCEPLNFSKKYPEAEGVVREPKTVDAAFTKEAWKIMQGLLSRNGGRTDDDWVLELSSIETLTRGGNTGEVRKRYQDEYIQEWRDFVKSARVVPLGNALEASGELGKLTENRSPLLELLCEVSENTSGTSTSPEIAAAFLPVNDVVTAPCSTRLVQDATNKPYLDTLSGLKTCIDKFQDNPAAPPAPAPPGTQREDAYNSCKAQQWPVVLTAATNAVKTVDHEANLDQCVVSLLKFEVCPSGKVIPPPISDAFCSAINRLSSKYPFNLNSTDEVTLPEFEAFFRPGGTLSQELAKGGASGSRGKLLSFAQSVQRALYPNGSPSAQYHFLVTATVPPGMKTLQLNLDDGSLNAREGTPKLQDFVWPGKNHVAELRVGDSKNLSFGGPWAVFHLFEDYSWSPAKGGGFHLVSKPLNGPQGSAFQDILDLKAEGAPIFRRGYLSQLRCSSKSHLH